MFDSILAPTIANSRAQAAPAGGNAGSIQARIAALQAEIASLQQQLGQASTVGEALAPSAPAPGIPAPVSTMSTPAPIATTTSAAPAGYVAPAQAQTPSTGDIFGDLVYRYANQAGTGFSKAFPSNADAMSAGLQAAMLFSDRRLKTNIRKC